MARTHWFAAMFVAGAFVWTAIAQAPSGVRVAPPPPPAAVAADVLTPQQWQQVDESINGGLRYLAGRQLADGSFASNMSGQPAVTALCVMAFLSRGHLPSGLNGSQGPYSRNIDAGIDYILSCQQSSGLICAGAPQQSFMPYTPSQTALYNHAIAGVLLAEVYGMGTPVRSARVAQAIEDAMKVSYGYQAAPKRNEADRGGWRYPLRDPDVDSDLSATSWQLMFLRSARNAGFRVPSEPIDLAMDYVQRSFDARRGTFVYGLSGKDRRVTRAVAGAGILSLSLGGMHDTPIAKAAGEWVLKNPFNHYNVCRYPYDRYHYGAYYCSLAMFQLGGKYWRGFYTTLVPALLSNQRPQGDWASESAGRDSMYGGAYTTALAVLSLSTPYQLLPIGQR